LTNSVILSLYDRDTDRDIQWCPYHIIHPTPLIYKALSPSPQTTHMRKCAIMMTVSTLRHEEASLKEST
jgi:hypothetical protein